ncbi:short-chain dehydrogenase [Dictyobacter vulcani]|uniref:Short-chain dehydrogenase n=1 Tax=Dictyobacter vulcani TaxID=2607529 RepID=A0A5J4KZF3_9CHLR|nr:SDR family oxidoreductase [Dictyobacter vulcani]GER91499.1 short-chain dehydrogenase [Dictyobacter vulcani]
MLLENKHAVIYGAGGAVGSAVALAFAREGARVFLVGRTLAPLEKVAQEISAAGGLAEIAQVDALDEQAVASYLDEIISNFGWIDISFNAVGLDDIHGTPLVEMAQEDFALPTVRAITTHFVTATAAARYMAKNGSGVILAITAIAGQGSSNVGGFGVACVAIEGFCRQLAAEMGSQGVRVVCLRSAGSPDAPGVDEVFHLHAERAGLSREAFEARVAASTMLKRLPRLAEVADMAVLMASDRASAITGSVVSVTCGE